MFQEMETEPSEDKLRLERDRTEPGYNTPSELLAEF